MDVNLDEEELKLILALIHQVFGEQLNEEDTVVAGLQEKVIEAIRVVPPKPRD